MKNIRFRTGNEAEDTIRLLQERGTYAKHVNDFERELSQNEYGDLEDCVCNIVSDSHSGWPVAFGKGECDVYFTCTEDGESYEGIAHVEYEVEDLTFDHAFGRQPDWGFSFEVVDADLYANGTPDYKYRIEYVFDDEHEDGAYNLVRIEDDAILTSKTRLDDAIGYASENKMIPFYIE